MLKGIVITAVNALTRTNSPYVKLKVGLANGTRADLNVWNMTYGLQPWARFEVPLKSLKEYNGMFSCASKDIRFFDEFSDLEVEKELKKFIQNPISEKEWIDINEALLDQFRFPELREIYKQFYPKLYERYSKCPAATTVHHAYRGGLVTHTYQMLAMLDGVTGVNVYPFDVCVDYCAFGILFHDFGKLFEYCEKEGQFDITPNYPLLGHIYISASTVDNILLSRKVLDGHRNNIVHIILSHHGKREWGSPVVPATQEAFLVHHLDMLSGHGDIYEQGTHMEKNRWLDTNIVKANQL